MTHDTSRAMYSSGRRHTRQATAHAKRHSPSPRPPVGTSPSIRNWRHELAAARTGAVATTRDRHGWMAATRLIGGR